MIDTPVVQRPDHSDQLQPSSSLAATPTRLDAIIVPSARTAPYLREAASLASRLGCLLVVLCSRMAKPRQILRDLEEQGIVVDVLLVDMPAGASRSCRSSRRHSC